MTRGKSSIAITVALIIFLLLSCAGMSVAVLTVDNTPAAMTKRGKVKKQLPAVTEVAVGEARKVLSAELPAAAKVDEARPDEAVSAPAAKPDDATDEAVADAAARKPMTSNDVVVAAGRDRRDSSKAAELPGNGGAGERLDVSNAIPGVLAVQVIDGDANRPLQGAEVFAPIAAKRVEMAGTDAVVPSGAAGLRKVTGANGIAAFSPSDIAKGREAAAKLNLPATSWSVLVRATGMVPLVEKLDMSALPASGRVMILSMRPAVEVTGHVASRESGEGIRGAKVVLRQSADGKTAPTDAFDTETNALGDFRIGVAAAYKYQVYVTADGFAPYSSSVFDFRRDERTLSIVLKAGRSIEGTVEADGKPLAGVLVRGENDGVETTSAEDGSFVLGGISDRSSADRLRMRFTRTGYGPVVAYALVNDRTMRVFMQTEATVSGVVTLDGKAVKGAVIHAELEQDKKRYPAPDAKSADDGTFTSHELGAGTVRLSAETSAGLFSKAKDVPLRAGETRDGVELVLEQGAVVRGVVTAKQADGSSAPLAGVSISKDGLKPLKSKGDGSFTFNGVSDTEHSFTIVNAGLLPAELIGMELFTLDGKNCFVLPKARKLTTHLGQEYELNFEVTPYFGDQIRRVEMVLSLDSRASIEGVAVDLKPTVGVGADGTKAGPISLKADLVNGVGSVKLLLVNGVDYETTIKHAKIITLKLDGRDLAHVPQDGSITVALTAAMSVTGYIRDSSGNAIPDADVRSYEKEGPNQGGPGPTAKSDALGYFSLDGLAARKYRMTVFRHSYYQYAQDITGESTAPQPLNIVLLNANEIRVTVVDARQQAVPGVPVSVRRPSSDNAASAIDYFDIGLTDAQGKRIVNFHWVRHYQIIARQGDNLAFVNFDNVKDQTVREFTIPLEPGQPLAGRVISATSGQPVADADVYASPAVGDTARTSNRFYARTNQNGEWATFAPIGTHNLTARASRAYQAGAQPNIPTPANDVVIPVQPKDKVNGNWAEFVYFNVPGNVVAGQTFTVSVTAFNRGSTTWTSGANYKCGSESPRDNGRWGTGRLVLPENMSVAPGASYTFTATLTAPSAAGTYPMQWRMLREGVEWFGERSAIVQVPVVAPPPPPAPPK